MNFDQSDRARLARLADVLIPAADGMPSASQADVSGRWLDAVLAARTDLAEGLRKLLSAAGDADPAALVAELRAHDVGAFEILAELVPAAYFMNPEVREAIGYQGQTAQTIDPRPDYMEDDLLASVIRRGPIYRPTEPPDARPS